MTDSTSPIFSLPEEILTFIASYLTLTELSNFKQVCRFFEKAGSHSSLLQPHYNRLKTLNPTLPALLPTNIASPLAFKQAFEKIRDRQAEEIGHLKKHHPILVTQYISADLIQGAMTIKHLEQRNISINVINASIISTEIDLQGFNKTSLNLNNKGLTRFPPSLINNHFYTEYWKNLKKLTCCNNLLTTLNLKTCSTLQELDCSNTPLTELNLEGTPESLRAEFAPIIEALLIKKIAQITFNQAPNFLSTFNNSAAPMPPQSFKRPAEENSEEEKLENQDSDSKAKRQKP